MEPRLIPIVLIGIVALVGIITILLSIVKEKDNIDNVPDYDWYHD